MRMFYNENMIKLHEEGNCRRNYKEFNLPDVMWDNGTIDGMKNLLSIEEFSGGQL